MIINDFLYVLQLYESAKKIERLELTKVEMKEQLELLDFQILEVENQKAMVSKPVYIAWLYFQMEEELRKLPSCNHIETQTDVSLFCKTVIFIIEVRWLELPNVMCYKPNLHSKQINCISDILQNYSPKIAYWSTK